MMNKRTFLCSVLMAGSLISGTMLPAQAPAPKRIDHAKSTLVNGGLCAASLLLARQTARHMYRQGFDSIRGGVCLATLIASGYLLKDSLHSLYHATFGNPKTQLRKSPDARAIGKISGAICLMMAAKEAKGDIARHISRGANAVAKKAAPYINSGINAVTGAAKNGFNMLASAAKKGISALSTWTKKGLDYLLA